MSIKRISDFRGCTRYIAYHPGSGNLWDAKTGAALWQHGDVHAIDGIFTVRKNGDVRFSGVAGGKTTGAPVFSDGMRPIWFEGTHVIRQPYYLALDLEWYADSK